VNYKIVILPEAKNDIRQAAQWYEIQSKGLGKRFTAHVRTAVNDIKLNPFGFEIRYRNTRTALVEKFPYMIHFTTDEQQPVIIVLAVFHTSRSPEIWETR